MITVQVVYLDAEHHRVRSVDVVDGSTALEAIKASRMAELVSTAAFDLDRLGIFSKRVSADHRVESGDRIEIYRPLILDPMEARRQRAR